jgi:hypothetical protein
LADDNDVLGALSKDHKKLIDTRKGNGKNVVRSGDLVDAEELRSGYKGDVGGKVDSESSGAYSTKADKVDDQKAKIEEMAEAEFREHYSQTVIYSLFALIFLTNVLINVDHGTLPACTQ